MYLLTGTLSLFFLSLSLAPLGLGVHATSPDLQVLRNRQLSPTTNQERNGYGLPPAGMQFGENGIRFGIHVNWKSETGSTVNQEMGKPAAIQGGYLNILDPTNTSFPELDLQRNDIIALANTSVWSLAIVPHFPLSQWTPALSQAVADQCAAFNAAGVTIWLRFAYEMNGEWMKYGLDPTNFISTWQSLTTLIRSVTKTTYMLWAPNAYSGSPTAQSGYTPCYPGVSYVDIAGVSLYWWGANLIQNTAADPNQFSQRFQGFYDLYSADHWIVVTETSAPYHYELPASMSTLGGDEEVMTQTFDGLGSSLVPTAGGATEVTIKSGWMNQLVGNATAAAFPKLLGVMWFNYIKTANNSGTNYLEDFRLVGDIPSPVTDYFVDFISTDALAVTLNATPAPSSAANASATSSSTASPTGTKPSSASGKVAGSVVAAMGALVGVALVHLV